MKRTIGAILFVIYSIVAITVTVLLLSFNDYNCSEIGGYTVYIVNDDSLEPEYEQGSILLIKETSDKHVQVGDEIFLYKVINSQEYQFINRTLSGKVQQGNHIVYQVEQDENRTKTVEEIQLGLSGEQYDSAYFVGKADDTIVIKGWGTLLSILESKWGYLFCIVIVSLLLFLQEVFDLIIEIKYGGTKGTKAANVANARKNAKNSKTKTTTAKSTTKAAAAKATVAKETATKTSTATKAATAAKTVATAAKANSTETGEKEG